MADLIGPPQGKVLDLGSGGGIPGLVLALAWPGVEVALLESRTRCAAFLLEAVETLALADRVEIIEARAEEAAHRSRPPRCLRPRDLRGFGPPPPPPNAPSASSPPAATSPSANPRIRRRPRPPLAPAALAQLNLTPPEFRHAPNATVAILTLSAPAPSTYPASPTSRASARSGRSTWNIRPPESGVLTAGRSTWNVARAFQSGGCDAERCSAAPSSGGAPARLAALGSGLRPGSPPDRRNCFATPVVSAASPCAHPTVRRGPAAPAPPRRAHVQARRPTLAHLRRRDGRSGRQLESRGRSRRVGAVQERRAEDTH